MRRKPPSTTAATEEVFTGNGWISVANNMYCKVLPHLNNVTCMLTTDGEKYELTIKDDVVPLDQWGFPEGINAQVICALSSFLAIVHLCEGVDFGNEKFPLTKSSIVQVNNGQHYLKHVRCPVVVPLLSKGKHCSTCKHLHTNRMIVKAKSAKVNMFLKITFDRLISGVNKKPEINGYGLCLLLFMSF